MMSKYVHDDLVEEPKVLMITLNFDCPVTGTMNKNTLKISKKYTYIHTYVGTDI